ncbi:hypothetical protein TNCV_4834531 [Trichonephila clavipes]|nr:hypothetical protein TNCV_4834531 [Trichonephila clavipes]
MSEGMKVQRVWLVRRAIKILHLVVALLFQKLLPGSSNISVHLGSRPPYMMIGVKKSVLVLLCLEKEVGETTLAMLCSGLTRAQRHVADLKVYPTYPNCNMTQADLANIMACIDCQGWYKNQLLSSPATNSNFQHSRPNIQS